MLHDLAAWAEQEMNFHQVRQPRDMALVGQ